MRTNIIYLIFCLVFSSSCKEVTPTKDVSEVKIVKDSTAQSPTVKSNDDYIADTSEYLYVNAKSGLNYRDAPKGKFLGKFALNQQVKVLEHTGEKETIRDDGKDITGEWLGVEFEGEMVYVFSGFLSPMFTNSNMAIYWAHPFLNDDSGYRSGFLNISESVGYDYNSNKPKILTRDQLGQDTIRLTKAQNQKLLKLSGVSASDTAFIFNLDKDEITEIAINKLGGMAIVSPYERGDDNLQEYSYQFGFDLMKQYKDSWNNFVYIGQTNPFQTGKIEGIEWSRIKTSEFEKVTASAGNKEKNDGDLGSYQPKDALKYANEDYAYYIQTLEKAKSPLIWHLVVIDKATNTIVYNKLQSESESIYFAALKIKDEPNDYGGQYTGAIFKDKPPILYGFESISFGCPSIEFVLEGEPPILIRCDNRH